METLESSRVCRLCGQQSGISINIFDGNENHVRKINAVLPIMVHEMDLLPKHMCHRCSYKLEEFHKFYVDCLKTDAALKSQLSWMRKGRAKEKTGVPMVHIENVNIKTEPLDYNVYELEPIVENIDYINTMANSVAFPAAGIHEGLAYAAFSRCRCYCDKKEQGGRRAATAELCRNYEESMTRCDEIANNSRRKALECARNRLRPAKRRSFARAVFQDRTQSRVPRVNVAEDARVPRLTTADTKNVSSLDTRNPSRVGRDATPESQAAAKSTTVRNLRPRRYLVNYALNKRRTLSAVPKLSARSESRVTGSGTRTPEFETTRQIKAEQIDESEGRTLRPRKNIVDYQESKIRKGSELANRERKKKLELVHRARREKPELAHRAKRRKIDDMGQSSKLRSKDEIASDGLRLKIKQEAPDDDLEDATLGVTNGTTASLPTSRAKIVDLPAKVETLATDVDRLRNGVISDYLGSSGPHYRTNSRLAKRKSIVANIATNKSTKPARKINQFPAANYTSKCLRSQDVYLRNGKARKYDYLEWSVKRLQTKKLMDRIAKGVKKVPAMLKLADRIKHYCETCNLSFMNKELFMLHACYYD